MVYKILLFKSKCPNMCRSGVMQVDKVLPIALYEHICFIKRETSLKIMHMV